MFSSMYAAYAGLSEGMQKLLLTLTAHHSSRHAFGKPRGDDRIGNPYEATQDARYPVVIRHPETRQRALYVNRAFTAGIEGWHDAESKAFLKFLYEHAQRPEFTCRFKWEVGSLAMWDNCVTWHRALNDYPGPRRYMHRITLERASLPAGRDVA